MFEAKHFLLKCQAPAQQNAIQQLRLFLDQNDLINTFDALNIKNKCYFLLNGDLNLSFSSNSKLLTYVAKFISTNINNM